MSEAWPEETFTLEDGLCVLLRSYERYYNINRENPMPPFAAEAEFSAHGEQYFLLKSAKWAEIDSQEFIFFACTDTLDADTAAALADAAWEEGLRRTVPRANLRNSDTVLVLLCHHISPEAERLIKKTNRGKSYRLGLWGFSNFKWIAIGISDGKTVFNRHGQSLKNLVCNIENEKRKGAKK